MIPHQLLIRVACIYAVSIEFLFGLDDEPERDSRVANRNAHVKRIDHMLKQHVAAVADALLDANHFDPAPALRQSGVISKVNALCDAVARFRAVNSEQFEKLRASATLIRTSQEASEAIAKVNAWLTRADNHVKFSIQRGRAAMASVAPTPDAGGSL